MNVLFLSSDYPPNTIGGVGIYLDQFARHLAKRGHQAYVITETEGTPCSYIDRGVRIWRIRREPVWWLEPARQHAPQLVRRIEYSMAVARTVREVLHRFSIDLVESCESRAEGFCHYLFNRRPPLFIKLHTPDGLIFPLNQQPRSEDIGLMLLLEEWWLRRATRLISLTNAVTQRVSTLYQLDLNRIPKVHIPVDTTYFHVPPAGAPRELQVLYVGRLEFRKGVHVLLRAIPHIMRHVPGVRFLFLGPDCGLRWLLERYQRDPRYGPQIVWRAWASREEVRQAYHQSRECVVPSLWDNHPTVCLEAMSAGCAVIGSRIGGIPEIIQHGATGVLVPPGSSRGLARAVVSLLTDHAAREALAARARAEMEREFDVDIVFDETITLYQGLLNGRSGHVPAET